MQKIEAMIAAMLLLGVLASVTCVSVGGIGYLWQHHAETLAQMNIHTFSPTTATALLRLAFSGTALGWVELGVMILMGTQLLRVALLIVFYGSIKDYKFVIISSYVLCLLLYSLLG